MHTGQAAHTLAVCRMHAPAALPPVPPSARGIWAGSMQQGPGHTSRDQHLCPTMQRSVMRCSPASSVCSSAQAGSRESGPGRGPSCAHAAIACPAICLPERLATTPQQTLDASPTQRTCHLTPAAVAEAALPPANMVAALARSSMGSQAGRDRVLPPAAQGPRIFVGKLSKDTTEADVKVSHVLDPSCL